MRKIVFPDLLFIVMSVLSITKFPFDSSLLSVTLTLSHILIQFNNHLFHNNDLYH